MYHPGRQIGPYRLVRKLGEGGFGEVWLADKRSELVTKRVAVKLPLNQQVDLEAIRKEATLWERVSGHANVLPIIDADIYDGQVVIVSEFAEDGSLRDWLDANGGKAPTFDHAVDLMIGILAGLAHLHSHKITHRDLKPSNILLHGETPRIADFGISRVVENSFQSTQTIGGTPSYMAPEAFRNSTSPKTDIWSAGVVFFELLSGGLPFYGDDMFAIMDAIRSDEPLPLPETVPLVLHRVVDRALRKAPTERFPNSLEMRRVLMNISRRGFLETSNLIFEGTTQPIDFKNLDNKHDSVKTIIRPRKPVRWKGATVGVSIALFVLFALAYWQTGPASVISDAVSTPPANSEPANTTSAANASSPAVSSESLPPAELNSNETSGRDSNRTGPSRTSERPSEPPSRKPPSRKSRPTPTPAKKVTLDDLIKDGGSQ
jgi:serine/threonine protein kinase